MKTKILFTFLFIPILACLLAIFLTSSVEIPPSITLPLAVFVYPSMILFFIAPVLTLIDFIVFMSKQKRVFNRVLGFIFDFFVIGVLPLFYITSFDYRKVLDCCGGDMSATFAPTHRLSIYFWIFLCMFIYFFASNYQKILPPILEVITNAILLLGAILNVLLFMHIPEGILVNASILLLFSMELIRRQRNLIELARNGTYNTRSKFNKFIHSFLTSYPLLSTPLIFLFALPIIVLFTAILVLFAQQPDSAIRAFTDTYHYGLSQLDYMCRNVTCGEHYLCSVAANGNKKVVKPQRLGLRNGGIIICNRQLLISNAFEEIIETQFPKLHHFIRGKYNKVGNLIHKYYYVFENKKISNIVYFLMKPLE